MGAFNAPLTCGACSGKGKLSSCEACNGSGYTYESRLKWKEQTHLKIIGQTYNAKIATQKGTQETVMVNCTVCRGTTFSDKERDCGRCTGKGCVKCDDAELNKKYGITPLK